MTGQTQTGSAQSAVAPAGEDFLQQLRRVNGERWKAWAQSDEPDPLYMSNEFGGEAGEVQNVVKKLVREQRGWKGSRATVAQLGDEIADCIICLDSLARAYGLHLPEIISAKFNATSMANGFEHQLGGAQAPSRKCRMCEDTGYKDYAGFAMDPCDHQPADDTEAVAMTAEEHRLEYFKQMAAYNGPTVSFEVREPYYLASCDACGWVGSSELCGTDSWGDDSDVYCPRCQASGADCGKVAGRIPSALGIAEGLAERARSDAEAIVGRLRAGGYRASIANVEKLAKHVLKLTVPVAAP